MAAMIREQAFFVNVKAFQTRKQEENLVFWPGAACRIRTDDLRFTKPLLYQLS